MDMQYCTECGSALDEKGQCTNPSCPRHRSPKQNRSQHRYENSTSAFSFKTFKFAEKGKKIVPECIEPDLDERHIRQYDIARLQTIIKGARAEGRLQVTNKRLIFRACGFSIIGPTSLQHEFSIEEIAGIEIRKEAKLNAFTMVLLIALLCVIYSILSPIFALVYRYSFIGTIFSILMAAASIVLFGIFQKQHLLRYTLMCIALSGLLVHALNGNNKLQAAAFCIVAVLFFISMLYMVFAPNLVIRILTRGGSPSVEIRRKDGIFSFQHNEYTGFSQVMPGPDTDLAIKELGALIREVQQTGIYSEATR